MRATQALQSAPLVRGVLVQEVPLRVLDVSAGGCLFETVKTVANGTVGVLEVSIGSQCYTETLRVCRTTKGAGNAFPCRAGAQFLTLSQPGARALRHLATACGTNRRMTPD